MFITLIHTHHKLLKNRIIPILHKNTSLNPFLEHLTLPTSIMLTYTIKKGAEAPFLKA